MELGRWSYGVVVRNTPTAQHRNGSTSCSCSEISGRRDADLYPLAAPRAAPTDHSIGLQSDPLAPPGGRRRRFLFSVIRFGAAMELGRWSYGVVVRNTPTAQHRNGSTSCSCSEISGRRDADLYPLAAPRAAPTEHSIGLQSDPLAPPGGRRRRFLFSVIRFGAAMELGRWSYGVVVRNTPTAQHRNGCLRRVLAPRFQAGEMPIFIPWRRRAPRRPSIARSAERPARAAWRPTSPISF